MSRQDLDQVLAQTAPAVWERLRRQSVFITGGTGFVGKWLLEAFLHANRALQLGLSIVVLTRSPDKFCHVSPHLAKNNAIELLRGDLESFAAPPMRCDLAVHAALPVAAVGSLPGNLADRARAGTRQVCSAVAMMGAKRFLHVSSGAVYGNPSVSRAVREDQDWSDKDAANAYAQAKRQTEAVVREAWPFEVVIARCFAFTGPNLMPSSGVAAASFMEDACHGRDVVVRGSGEPVRSFQYAADLARWLLTCLALGRAGCAYNVGDDRPVTIAQLAAAVGRAAGRPCDVQIKGQSSVGLAGSYYVPDTSLARNELGLVNAVDLDEGLRRMYAWRKHALEQGFTTT